MSTEAPGSQSPGGGRVTRANPVTLEPPGTSDPAGSGPLCRVWGLMGSVIYILFWRFRIGGQQAPYSPKSYGK